MGNEQLQLLTNLGIDTSRILIINLVDKQRVRLISELTAEVENKCNSHIKIILFDYATAYEQRPIDTLAIYNEITKLQLNLPWVFTTSDFNYYNTTLPNIVYFPYYAILLLINDANINYQIDIISLRKFLVGNLTRHLHNHRLLMLLKLVQQPWSNRCLYNFLANSPLTLAQQTQLNNITRTPMLTAEEYQIFTSLKEQSPIIADITDIKCAPGSLRNAAFTNCYINLFSEAGYPFPMVTEKSIIPYLTGQLPVILGSDGLTTHMQYLKFEIFDDIIPDINVNSTKNDIRDNINNIMMILSNLFDSNIEDIWNRTYERRLYNYKWVRSKEFLDSLVSPLRNALI
jgi:hypothetical protein